jgi:hypothetical protein
MHPNMRPVLLIVALIAGIGVASLRAGFSRVPLTLEERVSLLEDQSRLGQPSKVEWSSKKPVYFAFCWEQQNPKGEWRVLTTSPDSLGTLVKAYMIYAINPNGRDGSQVLSIKMGGTDGVFTCSSSAILNIPPVTSEFVASSEGDDPDTVLVVTADRQKFRLRMVQSDQKIDAVYNPVMKP